MACARRRARALQCVTVYLAGGIDLRVIEADDFRRTRLVREPSNALLSQRSGSGSSLKDAGPPNLFPMWTEPGCALLVSSEADP
jgi:hypothetical protein